MCQASCKGGSAMAILRLPVRWYSNEIRYGELELEVQRTAFMIVASDFCFEHYLEWCSKHGLWQWQ